MRIWSSAAFGVCLIVGGCGRQSTSPENAGRTGAQNPQASAKVAAAHDQKLTATESTAARSSDAQTAESVQEKERSSNMANKTEKSERDWKKELTPEQYHVLREKGTERAFTGKYWNHKGDGMYACAGCGANLFDSKTKFDSGCGWPSFYDALDKSKVHLHEDNSFGMRRTEVTCAKCGGHLGHVFDDGPKPTGQRYCINSVSIKFDERESAERQPAATQPAEKEEAKP